MIRALRVDVKRAVDHSIVRPHGDLTLRSAPMLRRTLLKAILDQGRVVVDLSAVHLVDQTCVLLFVAAQNTAGGWPAAKILLSGADPDLTEAIGRHAGGFIPLCATVTEALARLDERPAQVRRRLHLDCTPAAPAQCRRFICDTGHGWQLPYEIIEAAQLATSELVSNSVEHARSTVDVALSLNSTGLRIAVRDHSTTPPVHRTPENARVRGRGMGLVDAVTSDWGVLSHPGGKTVWTLFAVGLGLAPIR